MGQGPLVGELIQGGEQFLAEFQKSNAVRAAFWVLEDLEYPTDWHLYIASDRFRGGDVYDGYGDVVEIGNLWKDDPNFGVHLIRLVGTDHRFAKGALKLLDQYPGPIPIRRNATDLGGEPVSGLYVYPKTMLAASRAVETRCN